MTNKKDKEWVKKPNILLITTDTQRWDTLCCMGNPHAISPNIDRLAEEGVLFSQGHTSSPVCMPARCSLLTGLHTPIHGCIENGVDRYEHVHVFTDDLKEQGYTNIVVGKAHFGPVPKSFDIQFTLMGEKGVERDDFYAEHIRKHGYSRLSAHPNPIPEELFMDAFLVDTTIESIEKVRKKGTGPFFAFCSLPSPHSPMDPPGSWATIYRSIPLPEINYQKGEIEKHPLHLRRLVGTLPAGNNPEKEKGSVKESRFLSNEWKFAGFNEALGNTIENKDLDEINEYRRLYYGLAAYCDAQIGRLMEYLNRSGLRENTLVIFTSDHGQQFFDHGFNDKHNYYDSSWRVPLIISMPGTIEQGGKRDFAIWNDITATILAAAGTESPYVQGFDLFTPLQEGKESPRKCAVATLYKSAALTTHRWKLEYYFEEGKGRIFDRINDPKEQVDLYDNNRYEKVRNELVRALLTWRADICDLGFLINHTGGGGPVAKRIAPHTMAMKGTDAEERLNQAAQKIDEIQV